MILHQNNKNNSGALPNGLVPRGLTLEQVAKFVGLSKSGYKNHQRVGDYPAPTLPGKRYDLRLVESTMDRLSHIETHNTKNEWDDA